MKERALVILGLALTLIIVLSHCSNQLAKTAEYRMGLDYDLTIQPKSVIDRLDQNRASITETAKPQRMSGSTIILLTLIPILLLAGFAVFATNYEKIAKQTRLLMKKKKQSRPVQNVPLLEEGSSWLEN